MIKRLAQCCFLVLASLPWLWWKTCALFVGGQRAFEGGSQFCALVPGTVGSFFRSAFYRLSFRDSSQDTVIGFLCTFSHLGAKLGKGSVFGVCCNIGWAEFGENVLIGAYTSILSGRRQHLFADLETPIRLQGGYREKITIGKDCWIGNGSVIMADVGDGCVVAAGTVLIHPVPPYSIVAGNPGRIIGSRLDGSKKSEGAMKEESAP